MASTDTPLMKQYLEVKTKFQDCLLFFRLGDFYELFFEDATIASKILEIALTSRNKNDPNPIPMCGVPFHAATQYISRLVNAGYQVAVCEQLEVAGAGKGIVKRDVTRILSPGTVLDNDILKAKLPNYTHAAFLDKNEKVLWAMCDYSTGKFWFGRSAQAQWLETIQAQGLAEMILSNDEGGEKLLDIYRQSHLASFAHTVPNFYFDLKYASDHILKQFNTTHLEAIHPQLKECARPVGALIKYFHETQKTSKIPSLLKLEMWGLENVMELDPATIHSLELLPTRTSEVMQGQGRTKDVSLLTLVDHTKTAMGGRLLREWLLRPLTKKELIEERLDKVLALIDLYPVFQPILSEIYDLERLNSKISLGSANPYSLLANARDLRALAHSLIKASRLIEFLNKNPALIALKNLLEKDLAQELLSLSQEVLQNTVETPPLSVKEGGIFLKGYNSELDTLVDLSQNGNQWLADFEAAQRKATGIASLKVRFNRIFGYYIEITKANLGLVPGHYIRKQTMVGGERFITDELKTFEEKILTSEKKRCDMEFILFRDLCHRFSNLSHNISQAALAVATVDTLCSLAHLAKEQNYVRPHLDETLDIDIVDGYHPTVAAAIKNQNREQEFIPNSLKLTSESPFLIITGPNMGGKSTVMRQTALIVLMAQIGSFVPAKASRIGMVDRIFTRIGANDNIAEGSSTFMVEMNEMSFILRNATHRSLILLDEVGRGTSTYDGMSLAWALASEICTKIQARTLFSTHYHELTRLSEQYCQIKNARMAVKVTSEKNEHLSVRFLYHLEQGIAERSYGILVARLAGLPESVLAQAQEILSHLEKGQEKTNRVTKITPTSTPTQRQLDLQLGL